MSLTQKEQALCNALVESEEGMAEHLIGYSARSENPALREMFEDMAAKHAACKNTLRQLLQSSGEEQS